MKKMKIFPKKIKENKEPLETEMVAKKEVEMIKEDNEEFFI